MDVVRFKLGQCDVAVIPVLRGLVSEGERVAGEIKAAAPSHIALSASPEEVKALRAHDGAASEPLSGTVEENVYESGLSKFGAVERPPRCFVEAIGAGEETGARVVGVDLGEEEYTRAYVSLVSGWDFVRRALTRGSLARARLDMSSAEAFALDWDRRIRKIRGYDLLEKRREAEMARGLSELASRGKSIVLVVEVERFAGVVQRLHEIADRDHRSPESIGTIHPD